MKKIISKISTITLLLSFSSVAFPIHNLSIIQNITDGETLVSPTSIFELGFFSPGSSSKRFVGIWFTVSNDTVIWVANRDRPFNDTSGTLFLSKSGSILLSDSTGRIVWTSSSNLSREAADYSPILQLNDSGNLILKDQTSDSIVWQSFDHPTNTLLSGMKIGKNFKTGVETYLTSWKSSDDPSEGKCRHQMITVGAPEAITWENSQIIGRSGIWNGEYFSGVPEMLNYTDMFNFSFVWDRDEVSYEFEERSASSLSRLVLNESGILQRLVWDQTYRTWNVFWMEEKDECSQFARCGPFGVCQPDGTQDCHCLRGFEPLTPTEWNMRNTSGGCNRTTPLGCSASSDGFYTIEGVEVPYSHNATVDASISVKECRRRCLENCSCMAYVPLDIRGKGSGCVMWDTPLIDIKHVGGGQILYVKVSKSELGTSDRKQKAVTIGIISSGILVLVTFSLIYVLWRKKNTYSNQGSRPCNTELKLPAFSDKYQKYLVENDAFKGTDVPIFDMEVIVQATDNFSNSNKLGQGGFGIVYKGQLPCGQQIAAKRLSRESLQGLSEFMNEVLLLTKLQHRNLVRLLGCCIENNERMLIYEFMEKRSLDFYIFDVARRASLNWTMRLEIINGIARGLLYLHQDSRFNVIHRDLKAANVLLDEQMNPKISDFGTARLFKRGQGVIKTETVVGTRGYMPPEYVLEGAISFKSDVYSFGVLLLEIISGKRNQGGQTLLAYAWKLWEEGDLLKLLDEALESSTFATELMRYVHVGLLCVQECPDDRPSMSSVFLMLSSNTLLQDPKKPLVSTRIRGLPSDWSLYENGSSTVDQLTISAIEGR